MKKSSTGKKGSGTKTTSSRSNSTKAKKGGSTKSSSAKRGSGKRELINTGSDKRFVRRDGAGQFKEVDNLSRSLSADRKTSAKTKVKSGYGDRGDR